MSIVIMPTFIAIHNIWVMGTFVLTAGKTNLLILWTDVKVEKRSDLSTVSEAVAQSRKMAVLANLALLICGFPVALGE